MTGPSWLSRALCVATLTVRAASGLSISPSNTTRYQESSSSSPIELLLPDSGSTMKVFSALQPLFSSAASELRAWGLSDALYDTTATNYINITSHWISYISCDQASYPGYITLDTVFTTALAANVTAILLYSTTSDYCDISDVDSSYPYIYSMPNATAAQTLLNRITAAASDIPLHGDISFTDQASTNDNATSSNSSSSSSSSSGESLSASPTTAVAMIILYSITGVITALFLIIIITGALRAHRHPERYGPRTAPGRARQSRARGLARAMLDTIPIVKFGDHDDDKTADVEMSGHGVAEEITPVDDPTPVIAVHKSAARDIEAEAEADTSPGSVPRPSMQSERSGIAPAANGTEASPAEIQVETPGCSICTEDFQKGEDLRVLPCDHKFHPACIDPWLLNISGTCPLCRINLDPEASTEGAANGDLPPLIDGDDAAPAGPRPRIGMRQSFLIGLGLGRVHDTTREERIQAVRTLRLEQDRLREQRVQAAAEESADERSTRQRLRERFGIRTRQTGQDEVSAAAAAAGPAESAVGSVETAAPAEAAGPVESAAPTTTAERET